MRGRLLSITVVAAFGLLTCGVAAQELVPRAYWPAPKGTQLLVFGYQYTTGDFLTDPTLPVTGVDSDLNYAQVSYQYTLSLFGRTSNFQFNLPYTWGTTRGLLEGEPRRRELSGMGDARMLLSINLLGAPTLDRAAFQALRADPKTIVGFSVLVQPPTGSYDPDKVINEGTNRWAVKPAFGLIWPVYPTWLIEVDVGAWFFGDNDEFLGTTREQDPILSTEFHLVKRIKPGFWASLDLNYYVGGRTTVSGVVRADLQRNSRLGATVVIPFKRRHAVRLGYSTGLVTESGGDFDTISLNYAFAW